MLARANRVLRPADFRSTVRSGTRISAPGAVVHVRRIDAETVRFGFVVNKAVGNAVTRNLIKRRMRSVARELIPSTRSGTDVVIRALPGSDQLPWSTLHAGIAKAIDTGAIDRGVVQR